MNGFCSRGISIEALFRNVVEERVEAVKSFSGNGIVFVIVHCAHRVVSPRKTVDVVSMRSKI